MCREVVSELLFTAAQIYFSGRNKWSRRRSRCVPRRVNKSATARGGMLVSVVAAFSHCAAKHIIDRRRKKKKHQIVREMFAVCHFDRVRQN